MDGDAGRGRGSGGASLILLAAAAVLDRLASGAMASEASSTTDALAADSHSPVDSDDCALADSEADDGDINELDNGAAVIVAAEASPSAVVLASLVATELVTSTAGRTRFLTLAASPPPTPADDADAAAEEEEEDRFSHSINWRRKLALGLTVGRRCLKCMYAPFSVMACDRMR